MAKSTLSTTERAAFHSLKVNELSAEERAGIRRHLQSVMTAKSSKMSHRSTSVGWGILFLQRTLAGAALSVVLALTGGLGIARAAETSLPGEVLYPFKVRVNEPVTALFRRDRESRAAWERERAERRVQEAEILLESGRLSEEENTYIDDLLTKHRDTLKKYSDESDEDFISDAKDGAGRVTIEIEEEDGQKRYCIVKRSENEVTEEKSDDRDDEDAREKSGRSGDEPEDGLIEFRSEQRGGSMMQSDDAKTSASKKKGSSVGKSEPENQKSGNDTDSNSGSGGSGKDDSSGKDDEEEKDEDKDKDKTEDNSGPGSHGNDDEE